MNYVAIVVAGIFNMALGFLWYGPVFGKMWMEFNGYTKDSMEKAKKDGSMGMKYGMMFVSALVLAYFMNWLVNVTGASNWMTGALIGGMAWLGFTATTQFGNWIFSGKKFGAFLIDTGYFLVSFAVFGALFAVWK
ncbi:MAG TPA: DUF1761 domain-containing protein [Candidatus Eisenbacteria bacterium]|nr:DUF1761 domain-containing protein [Candidatus Eisenbacteria bacterium]